MTRILASAFLLVWVCSPLAAQRRTDRWAVQGASAEATGLRWEMELRLQSGEQIRPAGVRPRLGPAVGMALGGVAGAVVGVGLSRATCEPERCDGMANVGAFFLGGLTGAALGYIIAGGKRLPGTRPPAYPAARAAR